jgi:hypothetical protein
MHWPLAYKPIMLCVDSQPLWRLHVYIVVQSIAAVVALCRLSTDSWFVVCKHNQLCLTLVGA